MFTREQSKTESIFTTYPTQSYTLYTEVRAHVKRFDFPGGGSMLNRMRAGPARGAHRDCRRLSTDKDPDTFPEVTADVKKTQRTHFCFIRVAVIP